MLLVMISLFGVNVLAQSKQSNRGSFLQSTQEKGNKADEIMWISFLSQANIEIGRAIILAN